ncbi:4-hydroxythreonine-4-phosphate dehydrogenase PdxA [Rapidithrix thailandica]|uniref:4-hydroxythreonine-4-phosphate dehydrogenase PdxA n=1 Tax=Rapidithrix thailandica TaxID=413964 RepID=A0AAW9S468_9BACT
MANKQRKSQKPRIGITIGDINGIGPEIIIKVLQDKRIANLITPIIYGSGKVLTKYKRLLNLEEFSYHQYNTNSYLNEKKPNVVNCWHDSAEIQPGKVVEQAGKYALQAMQRATEDLRNDFLDAVVTCPINKANMPKDEFPFKGHTDYYTSEFEAQNSLMVMCSEQLKIAVLTDHIPLTEVKKFVTRERLINKVEVLEKMLKDDFGIQKPKIAVLGLNPHAGEEGLLGNEEQEVISPTLSELHKKGHLVFGPYPADGFFASLTHQKFDAVLAMYHDQGLIPFKILAFEEGVNYTAGLPIVRTSPDHGTAYNIAGKGIAHEGSLREAIFMAHNIVRNREDKIERKIRVNVDAELKKDSKDTVQN